MERKQKKEQGRKAVKAKRFFAGSFIRPFFDYLHEGDKYYNKYSYDDVLKEVQKQINNNEYMVALNEVFTRH